MLVVIDQNLWEFIAYILLHVCFYLKLILRISRLKIIVTHKHNAEDKTKLKKYYITHQCILDIIISLLSRHDFA